MGGLQKYCANVVSITKWGQFGLNSLNAPKFSPDFKTNNSHWVFPSFLHVLSISNFWTFTELGTWFLPLLSPKCCRCRRLSCMCFAEVNAQSLWQVVNKTGLVRYAYSTDRSCCIFLEGGGWSCSQAQHW